MFGTGERERDGGGPRDTAIGIGGADGTDPPQNPAVLTLDGKPGPPSPDDVDTGFPRAQQDRVLTDVGVERLVAVLGIEGVGQPGHPPADGHQPQVADQDAGPLGERFQDSEGRIPVQILGGGIVQQGRGRSEIVAQQLRHCQVVDGREAAKP